MTVPSFPPGFHPGHRARTPEAPYAWYRDLVRARKSDGTGGAGC
ncbi:hypothetical protein AB0467_07065 [Streptomyces sp. NPDC052095]